MNENESMGLTPELLEKLREMMREEINEAMQKKTKSRNMIRRVFDDFEADFSDYDTDTKNFGYQIRTGFSNLLRAVYQVSYAERIPEEKENEIRAFILDVLMMMEQIRRGKRLTSISVWGGRLEFDKLKKYIESIDVTPLKAEAFHRLLDVNLLHACGHSSGFSNTESVNDEDRERFEMFWNRFADTFQVFLRNSAYAYVSTSDKPAEGEGETEA